MRVTVTGATGLGVVAGARGTNYQRHRLAGAAAALALAVTGRSAHAQTAVAPGADVRARLAGTYGFAGGARERAGLETAIERTTDGMFFVIRGIARGRLRDRNPVHGAIAFRFAPGQVEVAYGGRQFRTPETGAAVSAAGYGGRTVRVATRVEAGRLVQTFSTEEGVQRNEFVPSPDGRALTLRVTVTSGQLPRPLRYELTYRR